MVGPVGTRWDVSRALHLEWLDLTGLPQGELRECEVVSGFLFATRRATFAAADGFDEARLDLGLRCYAVAGVEQSHEFRVTRAWRPWRRIRFDGRSESMRSIDRRNRRHFLAKWSARAAPSNG